MALPPEGSVSRIGSVESYPTCVTEAPGEGGNRHRIDLPVVVAAAVVTVVAVVGAFVMEGETLTGLFHDDSYFYMKTADNVARGRGVTFDGVNLTNGFHPLYLFLLAGLARVTPLDDVAGVRAVFVLDMALFLCGLALMNATLRRRGVSALGRSAAMGIALVALGFNDFGMEVRLLFPVFWLLVWLVDCRQSPSWRRLAVLGMACAVLVLTRLDTWLLGAMLLMVSFAPSLIRRRQWGQMAATVGLLAGPAMVVVAVYAMVNMHQFGRPGSISSWLKMGFPGTFQTGWLLTSVAGVKARLAVCALGAAGGLAFYARVLRRGGGAGRIPAHTARLMLALNGYVAAYLVLVLLLSRGGIGSWYFALPLSIVIGSATIAFAARGAKGDAPSRAPTAARLAAAALAVCVLAAGTWWVATKFSGRQNTAGIGMGRWMREHLPADARVYQVDSSGITGYFSRRAVINGDGLVNNFAYQGYLRSGRLKAYLRQQAVTYILWDDFRDEEAIVIPITLWDGRAVRMSLPSPARLAYRSGRYALVELSLATLDQIALLGP